nr:MAG TPA: hypothetical protein [Caudoviricetes sp.]
MRSHKYTFCLVLLYPFCKLKSKGIQNGGRENDKL